MNFCFFIGRLTKDPELRTTQSGKNVCSFSLAVKRIPDGTDFIDCVAWQKAAEIVTQYAHKGDRIAVTGQLRNRQYESKGTKYNKDELNVETLELIEKKTAETPQFVPLPDDEGEGLPF